MAHQLDTSHSLKTTGLYYGQLIGEMDSVLALVPLLLKYILSYSSYWKSIEGICILVIQLYPTLDVYGL